ncbi:MAG: hypothetical protein KatS3mg105_4478 [Gemmatales bacterium]|nr:MAG: hypothetical protein KatS3mg105_4478 [Gemmatales bacterium]
MICSPGGKAGTLACLDKETGSVVWRSQGLTDYATYSSVIPVEINGIRQYVQTTYSPKRVGGVAGVSAKDGSLLWYYPRPGYQTAVIPTPISWDHFVFVSAGYNAGCDLIKVKAQGDKFDAEQVYQNRNMINHHGGMVRVGDHIYGYSDRGGWTCLDARTGNVVWSDRGIGKGSVTCADGMLYCYAERDGTVALVPATPDGWKVAGLFTIPSQSKLRRRARSIWTHPVVANGKLYLRDFELIYCYDVKAP